MTYPANVNTETGEVTEDTLPPDTKTVYIPGVKAQAQLTNLARADLTGLEFRVLFAIGTYIPKSGGTISNCTVAIVAEAMERGIRGIEKVFASLRRKGAIERVSPGVWAINPRLLYRGSYYGWATEYPQAIDPSYEINSNGLDGKPLPRDYNRTLAAPTGDAS